MADSTIHPDEIKTVAFPATIILHYKSRRVPAGDPVMISWKEIQELFENNNIRLDQVAINYYGSQLEPVIEITEMEGQNEPTTT